MTSDLNHYPRESVTGVVLAGGEGRRMGGVDKGLVTLAGRPMVTFAIDALKAQCGRVVINANRNQSLYAALGYAVVADEGSGHQGPLSGMASAMAAVSTPLTLFVPCDSPLVSAELGARLWAAKVKANASIAVARDSERYHPVFALMDTELAISARQYLQEQGRRIDRWFDTQGWIQVDCTDIAESFLNINRAEERDKLNARLTPSTTTRVQ